MLAPSPKPSRLARSHRSPISSVSGRSRLQRSRICSARPSCSARSRSRRSSVVSSDEGIELAVRAGGEGLEERATPPLEAEQRPDQQTPVDPARRVLVEDALDVGRIEELVDAGLGVAEQPVEVLDALAPEPARVGRTEALLLALRRRGRQHALHRLAQHRLAVGALGAEELALPDRVLVDVHRLGQRGDLEEGREPQRELDELVVEKRDAGLERVRHAELVLDHEQAVQKGPELEVEGGVEVVVTGFEPPGPAVEDATKDVVRRVVAELAQDRVVEEQLLLLVWHEPLPEGVVAPQVAVSVALCGTREVAPGVAAEELVAPGAREDDLDELAREARDVVVRVALPDAQILEVP